MADEIAMRLNGRWPYGLCYRWGAPDGQCQRDCFSFASLAFSQGSSVLARCRRLAGRPQPRCTSQVSADRQVLSHSATLHQPQALKHRVSASRTQMPPALLLITCST